MKNFSIISLILFALIFSSCTQRESKTTLEFWTLQLNDFAPYINSKIAEYESLYPDIKIKWVDIPFSEGEKRTLSAVMSDNVPDVVNLTPSFSSTLQAKQVLLEISEPLENIYITPALDLCRQNEKYFAIPWYVTSSITIFNKEFLKEAGEETPPSNTKNMLLFAQQIQKNSKKYAFMPNIAEDGKMLKIMQKQGVDLNNFWHSPKTIQTYELYKKLYTQNLIPRESINQTHRDSLEKYMSAETAMLEAGPNFLQTIEQNANNIYNQTDVAPQQDLESGIVEISLMNLVIPAKTHNPKQAVDFALFITNNNNQIEFCKLAPVLPSAKLALMDEFFNKDTTLIDKGRKISANQLKMAKNSPEIFPNQKQINEIVDYTTQIILLNKKSIQDALKDGKNLYSRECQKNF